MSSESYWAESFGKVYLRTYEYAHLPEQTRKETENILRMLDLPRGSKILDLCCGWGRHAIGLAQCGYEVTGFDLSSVLLEQARADAGLAGVKVRWMHGDMRKLPFEAQFDAVINVYNSFGYLESEDADLGVLGQVHKALKPDGLFLQEFANLYAFVRSYHQPNRLTRFPNELLVVEEREFNVLERCLHIDQTLLDTDGQRTCAHYRMRIYSPSEITKMLQTIGFQVDEYFGNLDGSKLTLDSTFIVTLSHKKEWPSTHSETADTN